MENKNQRNPAQDQQQNRDQNLSGRSSSRDTSQPGREEEVVNQQEQQRVTNTDRGDATNRDSESTGTGRGNTGRGDSGMGRESGEGRQGNEGRSGEERTSQNRDTDSGSRRDQDQDVPDVGRDDAEKTRRETPRM